MAKEIDPYVVLLVILLSFLGLINFFSASYYYSLINFSDPYFYFKKFFLRITFLGILLFFLGNFLGRNLHRYKKLFLFLFFLAYLSIFLAFIPKFRLQETLAYRWVNLGFISFQPSEIIKPLAILFFIFLISGTRKFSLWQKNFIFLIFSFLLLVPIFLQPSLSNVLIIGVSLAVVFFSSLNSSKEVIFSLFLLAIVFLILILASTFWEYRKERLISFLTKGKLFSEKYFQLERSILAVSSGGFWGKGLGKSEVKISGLPQMLTDSIFTIYAEELGFLGSFILLILFFLLISRLVFLSKKERSREKSVFALAVSAWLFLQTFLHIASNIGFIIPTGVILPFFSYGASGQLAIYFSLGIISRLR